MFKKIKGNPYFVPTFMPNVSFSKAICPLIPLTRNQYFSAIRKSHIRGAGLVRYRFLLDTDIKKLGKSRLSAQTSESGGVWFWSSLMDRVTHQVKHTHTATFPILEQNGVNIMILNSVSAVYR